MIKAIIEIPKGSQYKYEIDKVTGELTLDRVIDFKYTSSYGFIKDTLAPDGDALDVFIIAHEPIPPLTIVKANIIGVFKCSDNGVSDDKVIAVLDGENTATLNVERNKNYIERFLSRYKKNFIVEAYLSQNVANLILRKCSDEFILNSLREASKIK